MSDGDGVMRVEGISDEPIPSEFLFDGWERFMFRVPASDYEREDELAFLKKHYEKVSASVAEHTKFTTEALDQATSEVYRLQKEPVKSGKACLSSETFGRKYLVLNSVKRELCVELYKQRIPVHKKILETLMRLRAVLGELIRCPRRIAFVVSEISDYVASYRQSQADFLLSEKIRAVSYGSDELAEVIRVLSHPFSTRQSSKDVLVATISNMSKLYDPVTCYLAETDDFARFSCLMKKRMSLFVEKTCDLESMTIVQRICHVAQKLSEFLGPENQDRIVVVGLCVARFWFGQMMVVDETLGRSVGGFEACLERLRNSKLRDLSPPVGDKLDLELTPEEFLRSNPMFAQIETLVFECFLKYCPSDMAHILQLIQLRFAAFAGGLLQKSIDDRACLPLITFLWKLLFIGSSLPFHRCVIFAEAHMRLPVYKGTLFRSCQVAFDALKLFPEFNPYET